MTTPALRGHPSIEGNLGIGRKRQKQRKVCWMKERRRMKRWQKALIIVPAALAACFVFWVAGRGVMNSLNRCLSCFHKVNYYMDAIVSAELVSQDEPLYFSALLEWPEIKGVKVKLTYENGKTKVVDAYKLKDHDMDGWLGGRFCYHRVGMFLDIGIGQDGRPLLEPGHNRVAMYCIDRIQGHEEYWSLTRRNPAHIDDDSESAYCMVDVVYMPG